MVIAEKTLRLDVSRGDRPFLLAGMDLALLLAESGHPEEIRPLAASASSAALVRVFRTSGVWLKPLPFV